MYRLQSAKPSESGHRLLRDSKLFASLDDETFERIYAELEWFGLEVGETLFSQDEKGDGLFILVYGRLGVRVETPGQPLRFVGEVHPGELIGEMGMLTEEPRSATVWALRGGVVVRLSRSNFMRLAEEEPRAMLAVNRLLIERLRRANVSDKRFDRRPQLLALVPVSRGVPLRPFSEKLARDVRAYEQVLLISSDDIVNGNELGIPTYPRDTTSIGEDGKLFEWLNKQEQRHNVVLLVADDCDSPWTKFCIRYADELLLLGDAQQRPQGFTLDRALLHKPREGLARKRRLVLLQPDHTALPTGTSRWLDTFPVDAHHHIRMGVPGDTRRLARFLTRRAVALAMAGGAARGYAHIGVMRALEEQGIPIDLTCGASAGATLGALHAKGLDSDGMADGMSPFFSFGLFTDIDLPVLAFLGTKFLNRALHQMFGDHDIEDLWLPYFASASNLNRAEATIFRRGPVLNATRASGSLPGLFPPYVHESGDLLVDGAVLANLPAPFVDRSTCTKLISVNVIETFDPAISSGMPDQVSSLGMLARRLNPFRSTAMPMISDIVMRSIFLNGIHDAAEIRKHSDLYLEPMVSRFGFFDFHAYEAIINAGYHSTQKQIASWVESDPTMRQIIEANRA